MLILLISFISFMLLQKRAKIADIVSDEAAWDFRDSLASATGMKVAFLQDGFVARVLREEDDTYLCDIQDTFHVRKSDVKVELWTAADGKGIVYLKHSGKRPAYSEPDRNAAVVADLMLEKGYLPETYPCLGLEDGWFKIDVDGKQAFIQAEYVCWDAINTF